MYYSIEMVECQPSIFVFFYLVGLKYH